GVTRFIPQVSGARSIVETWHGFPNAYTVARQLIRRGYRGCWVLALGTNDTADVAVGSAVGLAARITRMMSLIGSQPVMWVNLRSLLASGPYSEGKMQQWNRALLRACPQYPGMRVRDVGLRLGLHQHAAQDPGPAGVGGHARVAPPERVRGHAQRAQEYRVLPVVHAVGQHPGRRPVDHGQAGRRRHREVAHD